MRRRVCITVAAMAGVELPPVCLLLFWVLGYVHRVVLVMLVRSASPESCRRRILADQSRQRRRVLFCVADKRVLAVSERRGRGQ